MKSLKINIKYYVLILIILILFILKFYLFITNISKNNEEKEVLKKMITTNYTNYTDTSLYSKSTSKKVINNPYIAILEIPKINLIKGLVNINSESNNVNKNIQIIKSSTFPDIENGNLILAAHSGTSNISYFKNLYKLNINDIVNIYYNNHKYSYKIVIKYNVEKKKVIIKRNINKTCITLITCDKNNKNEQMIFVGELQ